MNAPRLFCLGVTTLVLAVSSIRAADGDDEWKKVNDIIEAIRNPKENPQTSETARMMLKHSLTEFDATYAAAMKSAPTNPARWDVALFASMLGHVRELADVAAPEKELISLDDIVKATDAKPETRSQASLTQVMLASDSAVAPGGDAAAWVAMAEKHLNAFPDEKLNKMVVVKLQEVNLKTQPLGLKFTAVDGRAVDVSKLQGKVVLIDFWATWCGPCVEELPTVLKIYKEQHANGFEVIGVSLDADKAELEAFLNDKGVEWPQYFDGKGPENELFLKFNLESIPTMWLLNKKGVVVSMTAFEGLEGKVKKLLAE